MRGIYKIILGLLVLLVIFGCSSSSPEGVIRDFIKTGIDNDKNCRFTLSNLDVYMEGELKKTFSEYYEERINRMIDLCEQGKEHEYFSEKYGDLDCNNRNDIIKMIEKDCPGMFYPKEAYRPDQEPIINLIFWGTEYIGNEALVNVTMDFDEDMIDSNTIFTLKRFNGRWKIVDMGIEKQEIQKKVIILTEEDKNFKEQMGELIVEYKQVVDDFEMICEDYIKSNEYQLCIIDGEDFNYIVDPSHISIVDEFLNALNEK
ncbi:hypothetical protein ACFL1H_03705 [Nanoarchaeota archaeon]